MNGSASTAMMDSKLDGMAPILDCSVRQWDVLVELCRDGAMDETIGRRLYMAPDTVKSHTKALFRKAQVPNRTALAVRVLRGEYELQVCGAPVRGVYKKEKEAV